MKIKYFYAAFGLLLVCFLSVAAISSNGGNKEKTNKDIIKFSHSTHKEVTDCAGCHTAVSESTSLKVRLLPEKSVCATCHDVNDEKNCNMCHYEDVNEPLMIKTGELFFNHKLHLGNPNTTCESCHKGLSEVAYSFEAKESNPSMNICYSCHSGISVAANECQTCHISTVNLLPQDHKGVSFSKTHKFKSMEANANCQMCHDNSFCEACHAGATMLGASNSKRDFPTPFSPHNFVNNTKQQNLTRAHDMNYRFTHGIDLKGKTTECQTCHQTETFCAECHQSAGKGDFALEGVVPISHKMANFVTIGVGSGGGEHSVLAKRDIERCASCHDVQGADANCILCHVDADGIKGTNPKTHKASFMRSSNGDWHNDINSLCFDCHKDANARPGGIKGVGFCGYCHK